MENKKPGLVKPREEPFKKELEVYDRLKKNLEGTLWNPRSMNRAEILSFLKENNIQPLSLKNWTPQTPIIVVFDDSLRKEKGVFQNFSQQDRPSLARVDCPTSIALESDGYALQNGGQIDYYVISPIDKKIRCVKSSANFTRYFLTQDNIFVPADSLFPKQSEALNAK